MPTICVVARLEPWSEAERCKTCDGTKWWGLGDCRKNQKNSQKKTANLPENTRGLSPASPFRAHSECRPIRCAIALEEASARSFLCGYTVEVAEITPHTSILSPEIPLKITLYCHILNINKIRTNPTPPTISHPERLLPLYYHCSVMMSTAAMQENNKQHCVR